MNRGIFITAALAIIGAPALNLALYSIAHAGGPGEIAVIAAIEFNPLSWPWMDIGVVAFAALGALAGFLRVLAPMTKSTADDRLLGWVDWLAALLARIVVPGKYKTALATVQKLGLSNGKGGVGDQPPPPPPPFSSGGKSVGGAS